MNKRLTVCFAWMVVLTGCSLLDEDQKEAPVARVFEQYLYPSDLSDAVPPGTNSPDSTILARRYIDTWVRDQLMLHRAEQALTEEQKDFEKQIAEYRKSLLIFSYRQKLLQQKLDTVVSEPEIRSYYEENLNNFMLGQDVIKGTFVKVSLSAPRMAELRAWSRSNNGEALAEMEKYCLSYADKFSDFNDTWVYFSSIKVQFPMQISNPSAYLRYNRNIETTDSRYRYFLHISDHLTEGEPAPLEMVSQDITNIILNKRKIEFFRDLEQRVYNDGVSRNQFEIYQ
ncbi:MAG TPA: peptidyl-prolyl cis-trans isomerase [Bacteroides sp.]|nr:peptidyl-prolyl cis-trans isomerase [Bacteroides sp.]